MALPSVIRVPSVLTLSLLVTLGVAAHGADLLAQANFGDEAVGTSSAEDTDAPKRDVLSDARHHLSRLRRRGVVLEAGSIRAGSGLGVGVEIRRERLFGTPVGASLRGAWTLYGYQEYDVRVGMIRGREYRSALRPIDADVTSVISSGPHLAFGTSLYVHARQRGYPRFDFYGLGTHSEGSRRTSYSLGGGSVDLVMQRQFNRRLGIAARAGVIEPSVGRGNRSGLLTVLDTLAPDDAPGAWQRRAAATFGVGATLDFSTPPPAARPAPRLGVVLWHGRPEGGPESWTSLVADVRQTVPTLGGRGTLALRALAACRLDAGTAAIPFYFQYALGGGRTVRGLSRDRLRGEALWAATAEYRLQVHRWVQVAPFVDVGSVAATRQQLGRAPAIVTPGFGVRTTPAGEVAGRLDIAIGPDGARAHIALTSPF